MLVNISQFIKTLSVLDLKQLIELKDETYSNLKELEKYFINSKGASYLIYPSFEERYVNNLEKLSLITNEIKLKMIEKYNITN